MTVSLLLIPLPIGSGNWAANILVTEHLQYPVHFCFPLSQQKTKLLLIFNQLRFPFSSLHLLASCILFHCFRHTFASTVTLANNISLEVVSKMLGHTNTRMTNHYAKLIDKCIGEQMDKLMDTFTGDSNY
ncbi:MAG: tyrosine-type recombinase/integrase [Lachnospiraceae bacterium]|nr:tyrosine-type recombinase/integrase [Phocaeicola faecicola]MCI7180350.1 tyrosine-type recombinase/integrase [Lachnospiraceae bacterium]